MMLRFWRSLTSGRALWFRNNMSTTVSQLVDTIIVNCIFLRWGLNLDWTLIGQIIVANYICKALMALMDTPVIYVGRMALERFLGIGHDARRARAPLS